jgi:hypothetical protein
MVTSSPDVKVFDGDQASKFTQDAIEFCKEFERQRRATVEFVEMLDKASLFEQKSVAFTPRDAAGTISARRCARRARCSSRGLAMMPTARRWRRRSPRSGATARTAPTRRCRPTARSG